MLLSDYNKIIFSVFSEDKNFLIITFYAVKFGRSCISYLQIQHVRTDSNGHYLPSYFIKTRLNIVDCSEWDIIFSQGKIIFKEDSIKLEYSDEMVMVYLNFFRDQMEINPLKIFGGAISENESVKWNSYDFRSSVKGSFITPLTRMDFNDSPGNIDMIKTKSIPFKIPVSNFLWSRLHNKEIDLSYSFIFNRERKFDSKLVVLHNRNVIEFNEIDYFVKKEKLSQRRSISYPEELLLKARNNDFNISVNVYDNSETSIYQSSNNIDFFGKLIAGLVNYRSGYKKELNLKAKADIILQDNNTTKEFRGINSISEYIRFGN